MTRWLLAGFLALSLFAGIMGARAAEGATPPSAGLSQAQFDGLVDAISKAIIKKLEEEGKTGPSKATAPAKKGEIAADNEADEFGAEIAVFGTRAKSILLAYPALFGEVARIPGLLDLSSEGGRDLAAFLLLLAGATAAALGAEALVRRILLPIRRSLETQVRLRLPSARRPWFGASFFQFGAASKRALTSA